MLWIPLVWRGCLLRVDILRDLLKRPGGPAGQDKDVQKSCVCD